MSNIFNKYCQHFFLSNRNFIHLCYPV